MKIRSLKTIEDYFAVEQLQKDIWGAEDIDVLPRDLVITAQKNGGLMLGAFDEHGGAELLTGFVFGFVGLTADRQLKHCSHAAGVSAGCRDRNVGYELKLAQRQHVMDQGIQLITWTFDPLETRNARFNFHKLGVTCATYYRNLYGEMRDTLNANLPSDRFQVDWNIASARVEACLSKTNPQMSPSSLRKNGVEVINETAGEELLRPNHKTCSPLGDQVMIEVPIDFQSVKSADPALGLEWRLHTRDLFESAFQTGYMVTDLLVEDGKCFYLLRSSSQK